MSRSFRSRSSKRRTTPNLSPGYNPNIEKLRIKEYPQLKDQTYLDHSGTTLYAESLLTTISADLRENLYGNPHSENPSSKLSANKVNAVRLKVLALFKADPAKYDVAFCANTTAGVKLVADSFAGHEQAEGEKGKKNFEYRFHKDCHTSLIGPRGMAGSSECFWGDEEVEAWLDSPEEVEEQEEKEVEVEVEEVEDGGEGEVGRLGLFAWPGQSNFSGRRLPIHAWSSKLRQRRGGRYYSLFDAAALVFANAFFLAIVLEGHFKSLQYDRFSSSLALCALPTDLSRPTVRSTRTVRAQAQVAVAMTITLSGFGALVATNIAAPHGPPTK
ncbi:hypothetical protein C7212DRAFT_347487 [Tuber magnatum]|uniref:Aminotransferase class V domain-containing protein n=1 Tax=Tuber magnatum TaxID=42249 RepID=A0A317SEY1_9PEZI|nr:hypothetical protein C7212DRAFT_347487 [Tuber magnatum]